MRVVVGNGNRANRINLANENRIGRVNFSRVAQLGSVSLGQLTDVVTTGQQEGDVLVYNSVTNTYQIKTIPRIDGGLF